jgi:hypothetical protein
MAADVPNALDEIIITNNYYSSRQTKKVAKAFQGFQDLALGYRSIWIGSSPEHSAWMTL